jgi:hypothetical protein
MEGRKQGRPEDELFLRYETTSPDTPTIGPLRIQKQEQTTSGTPPPRTDSAGSGRQPTQPPAFSRPPPMPSFPAPPNPPPTQPLPYPEDDRPPHRFSPSPSSPNQRTRFDAGDPNRPTVGGYGARNPDGSVQPSRLAERRGTAPKPLPDSPGPETPDKEGLFQRPPQRKGSADPAPAPAPAPTNASDASAKPNPFPDYHQQYWPPPNQSTSQPEQGLKIPNPSGVNRLSSTASTSTVRAQRGSPPPPETPIIPPPGGGIEARFAAAGIAGTSTLTNLQAQTAQNAAAAQRNQIYANQQPRPSLSSPTPSQQQQYQQPQQSQQPQQQQSQQQPQYQQPQYQQPQYQQAQQSQQQQQEQYQQPQPARRPWTPTEQPGQMPHGPPQVYQGMGELSTSSTPPQGPLPAAPGNVSSPPPSSMRPEHPLTHDMGRLNMNEEPPPSYTSSIQQATAAQAHSYPNEKGQQKPPVQGVSLSDPNQGHPAFANDHHSQQAGPSQQPIVLSPTPTQNQIQGQSQNHAQPVPNIQTTIVTQTPSPAPGPGPASPPPLPEGWIAHLDPSSGQYYYIHLPTQSTQWEFPKGPTPLNLNEPLSPTGTFVNPLASPSFGKAPLASPGFAPQTISYSGDFGMAPIATPTTSGFTGPPPTAGVDTYKVAPTNGVYFGPYLRYTNMDIERGLWLGSILLATNTPHPPTIHIHQSTDLSPNPRQLKANPIYTHQTWIFYRYDIDLKMDEEHASKWTYAITSHLGCTRFEFLVAGRHETSWRFIAHSGNDFALNVSANERTKLGGIGTMWKDILQKNAECGGFHVQLGLGGQIYADRLWKEIPLLKQWTATSGKEARKNAPWTAKHEEEVCHAYFHYYTSHFDQPHLREAFAQIPHILALDDHDM